MYPFPGLGLHLPHREVNFRVWHLLVYVSPKEGHAVSREENVLSTLFAALFWAAPSPINCGYRFLEQLRLVLWVVPLSVLQSRRDMRILHSILWTKWFLCQVICGPGLSWFSPLSVTGSRNQESGLWRLMAEASVLGVFLI